MAQSGGTPLCSAVEHRAVLRACEAAAGRVIHVRNDGIIDLESMSSTLLAIDPAHIAVVSVMMANNETDVIQSLDDVTELVRGYAPDALVHTDSVHAFPWLGVAHAAKDVDLNSVSAHRFGGAKGVGALVVREGVNIQPILRGGGQERERRSGTLNVAGIVGMVAAARICVGNRDDIVTRARALRDRLADELLGRVPDAIETGIRLAKTAGNCHVRFADVRGDRLVAALDGLGICASTGSACAIEGLESNHALTAMGLSQSDADSNVRLSLGATTTDEDVDVAIDAMERAIAHLRQVK